MHSYGEPTTTDVGRAVGQFYGYRQRRTIVVPSGSTSFLLTVPGDQIWRVRHLFVEYVSDAVAGTRTPNLSFVDNDGSTFAIYGAPVGQPASSVRVYQWRGDNGPTVTDARNFQTVSVPDIYLNGGDSVSFGVSGSDVADTVVLATIILEVLRNGSDGYETGRRPVHHISTDAVYLVASDSAQYLSTEQGIDRWRQNP